MGIKIVPTDRWAWLRKQLKADEGLRLEAYLCPEHKVTIGYGHNLEAKPVPGIPAVLGHRITRDQAERLLENDMLEAVAEVREHLPWTELLAPARFDVLANMVFNMGIGAVIKFPAMLKAMQQGDFGAAATEMYDSRWASQVGDGPGGKDDRVDRLATIMRSGEYPEA